MYRIKKVLLGLICIALGLVILFYGISFVRVLHKAQNQIYLLSDVKIYHFTGYYYLAALNGGICIALLAVIGLAFILYRRSKRKE